MIAPARRAAYEVLRAVNGGRADLPHALARSRAGLEDERDRALAGEIAIGTLRWQGAFDHVVEQFGRRPIARLDPEVLDILRLTMFQLLHLDRIPASAAVNDAVDLARKAGKKSAAPLVNAVLRRVSRERRHLPLPPRPSLEGGWHLSGEGASHLSYLAVTLSHPRWLVDRWLERYGFAAAEAWARFDNAPAALTLRVNRLRATRDEVAAMLARTGVVTEPTRFAPDGLVVRSGNPLLPAKGGWHLPDKGASHLSGKGASHLLGGTVVEEGLAVVQDEASQLVAVFAAAQPGDRVLDLCASPGGKTTAMAAAMEDRGSIVACDVRARRMDLLATTVRRSGAASIRLAQADAARPLPFGQPFDLVLLDAPCSGLGTLRRDPDIRWRRSESDLRPLADAQLAMLGRAASAVGPGGRVVYATCSSEPEENEDVVRRFLASEAGAGFSVSTALPAEVGSDDDGSEITQFLTRDGYFQTLPFRDGLEAFFAAMLVRTKDLQ